MLCWRQQPVQLPLGVLNFPTPGISLRPTIPSHFPTSDDDEHDVHHQIQRLHLATAACFESIISHHFRRDRRPNLVYRDPACCQSATAIIPQSKFTEWTDGDTAIVGFRFPTLRGAIPLLIIYSNPQPKEKGNQPATHTPFIITVRICFVRQQQSRRTE
ncbi:hypothetical protein QBC45DRAFT_399357 [Copromyces sp. CBS 386.78]|nr:hypothetical protein QBC45DRAFT_399357 [Copromyces sp. CBS 386.78]